MTTLVSIKKEFQRELAKAKAENKRLREKVTVAQAISKPAKLRRRLAILKATGGISGISTRAQQRFELKARKFLGKQGRQLAKGVRHNIGLSPTPSQFLNMLSANKSLSKGAKLKAFKTYVRKHGRRSSTLD